jgi:putative peptide zinc metalloprotease protein
MRQKRIVATFVVAALISFVAVPVPAWGQQDNTSVEVNTKDGRYVYDLSLAIVRVMSDTVDNSNGAAAVSSCEDCKTIAVAIQMVLVMSDPDVATPTNLAIAMNIECTSCETMALAFQYVLTTGGIVRISAEGNQAIADLKKELKDILKNGEDVALEEIAASVSALVEELFATIVASLEPVGPTESPTPTPTPTESATPSPEVSPSGTPDPSASPTPTEEPTQEPTPEPTEEPTPAPSESPAP